jgi:hypothetical protein
VTGTPRDDDPAVANSPDAAGGPPDVTERVSPGAPPPASNQARSEPISSARDVTGAAGTLASGDPQSPHAVPQARRSSPNPVAELDAARTAPAAPPSSVPPGTPAPGNAQGVSVPATESAPGTSQQSNIVEGVRASPGAVPGRAEGEVDTR